jgi:hypothetical protein
MYKCLYNIDYRIFLHINSRQNSEKQNINIYQIINLNTIYAKIKHKSFQLFL